MGVIKMESVTILLAVVIVMIAIMIATMPKQKKVKWFRCWYCDKWNRID